MEMHFGQGMTHDEIARTLGISQQVVSKHIFGVLREGRRVGGAIAKLRRLCAELGLDPEKWV
jgi:predicted transcriptional regulator